MHIKYIINGFFLFAAITYSTGCAATMAALSLLKVGDHILSASDIYGGTHYLLKTTAEYKGVQLDFFDVNNIDTLDKLIKPNTKVICFFIHFFKNKIYGMFYYLDGVGWITNQSHVQSGWH